MQYTILHYVQRDQYHEEALELLQIKARQVNTAVSNRRAAHSKINHTTFMGETKIYVGEGWG